jgi:hypothetical protein
LDTFQVNKESWEDVKACLICSLEQKHSPKTVCYNFQDLAQTPGEVVYLYFAQNMGTFKRFRSSKPNKMPLAIQANNNQKKIWKDAKVALSEFYQTQLFITRLGKAEHYPKKLCKPSMNSKVTYVKLP